MTCERAGIAEIDRKLRDDFRRRLKDYGSTAEATDPILSVLFRSVAAQIDRLCSETDRMRLALLDELIAGLGIERRIARPAQTIVRYLTDRESALIHAGTELLGEASSGERLTFSTDAHLAVSSTRLALVALYQQGQLQLLTGLEMSENVFAARPSLEPASANLGPTPALFLALENLNEAHLSHHGFFFEISPYAVELQKALLTEPWYLARPDGTFAADGILRPSRGNAGVRALRWLLHDSGSVPSRSLEHKLPELPDGFYAGRVFLFPSVPLELRYQCGVPRGMEFVLPRLFGAPDGLFSKPRAWIRINLPPQVTEVDRGITNILLHAVSASNIECVNQTIYFERDGTSIPVSREAGTSRFLVSPLSVIGESGSTYASEFSPVADPAAGRFTIRNGRMVLRPGRTGEERSDSYANLRLWMTNGAAGNSVGPGQVRSFLRASGGLEMRIVNPTGAAGGSDAESFADAQSRFAYVLLSRERLITRADLLAAVRAFDRRIHSAAVSSELRRTDSGLERVHLVTAMVRPDHFLDFARESRILREELAGFLQERCLFDTPIVVKLVEAP